LSTKNVWAKIGLLALCFCTIALISSKEITKKVLLNKGENLEVLLSDGSPLVGLTWENGEMDVGVYENYKPLFHITLKKNGTNTWTLSQWSNNDHVDTFDLSGDGISDMRKVKAGTKKTTELFFNGKFQEANISNAMWYVKDQPVKFVNGNWITVIP